MISVPNNDPVDAIVPHTLKEPLAGHSEGWHCQSKLA